MVRSVVQSFSFLALKILRARQANSRESVVSAFVKSREQDEDLGVFNGRVIIAPALVHRLWVSIKEEQRALHSEVLSECDGYRGRS